MKQARRKRIVITSLVFVAAVAATVVFVREIIAQSALLEEHVTTLDNDQAQQTQLAQLKRSIAESEADRTRLTSFYLQTQSDSIDFLNYIEALASEQAITLTTTAVGEELRDQRQLLTVQYEIVGSQAAVERFVQLLETIPFVSTVTSVRFAGGGGSWQASVIIEVIVLDHESNS